MSKRTFGSLADLAKIMEAAADPHSVVREDRPTPKAMAKKASPERKIKAVDPKRKAWYDRRLREQAEKAAAAPSAPRVEGVALPQPEVTRGVVSKVGGTLLQVLADARSPKQGEDAKKRPEAWRRKPGDPIF